MLTISKYLATSGTIRKASSGRKVTTPIHCCFRTISTLSGVSQDNSNLASVSPSNNPGRMNEGESNYYRFREANFKSQTTRKTTKYTNKVQSSVFTQDQYLLKMID